MVGLALAGGGVKGSYQIGAYMAFKKCHIKFILTPRIIYSKEISYEITFLNYIFFYSFPQFIKLLFITK